MSGGGVYVGSTRGRHDNTIHIVADDLEDAKAQFITTMTRDRADRGLDQARVELAQQLPKHIMAIPPRVREYIDKFSQRMAKAEADMDRLQPLADHQDKEQAFHDRHQTTVKAAQVEADSLQQSAADKAAKLETLQEQLHRKTVQQFGSEIKDELSQLQAKERRVRNVGFFKRAKAKHDARTARAGLEDRYGIDLPGTDDE